MVEGVIVDDNFVISMGVYIGQSTRIHKRMNAQTRAETAINDLLRD
jgi:tetrahydrodipicolinate N-succinyltransferase